MFKNLDVENDEDFVSIFHVPNLLDQGEVRHGRSRARCEIGHDRSRAR